MTGWIIEYRDDERYLRQQQFPSVERWYDAIEQGGTFGHCLALLVRGRWRQLQTIVRTAVPHYRLRNTVTGDIVWPP